MTIHLYHCFGGMRDDQRMGEWFDEDCKLAIKRKTRRDRDRQTQGYNRTVTLTKGEKKAQVHSEKKVRVVRPINGQT